MPYRPMDWHTEAIANKIGGFTEEDVNVIKSEVNKTVQTWFGGNPSENTPAQFAPTQTATRKGDPTGVIGFGFRAARKVYYTMQHVPVVNNLGFWRAVDRFVLEGNENPVVQRYLLAIDGQPVVAS